MSIEISLSDLSFFKIEIPIDMTKVYEKIDKFVEEHKEKGCIEVLNGILSFLKVPEEQEVEDFVVEMGEKYVFSQLIEVIVVDEANRPIFKVPRERRQEFDKMRHYLLYLKFYSLLSIDIFNKLKESGFPVFKCILSKLNSNPFLKEDMPFIEKGIWEHTNGHFMASILILGLRIEGVLRSILKRQRINTLRKVRDGTVEEISLGRIFKMRQLRRILGNGLYHYLRVLLIIKEGENIRNRLAHSMAEYNEFNPELSSLLLLALLFIDQRIETMT